MSCAETNVFRKQRQTYNSPTSLFCNDRRTFSGIFQRKLAGVTPEQKQFPFYPIPAAAGSTWPFSRCSDSVGVG